MGEIIFVILLAGGMIGSGIYVGIRSKHWHLLYVFLTFFTCFGLIEWWATATTGMTVSQQVWDFGKKDPIGLWCVVFALIVSWLALMWHFLSKKLGSRDE